MLRSPSMVRVTALVAAAALALHELRYLIGYGGRTPEALASQGHGYLTLASAVVGLLLVVALAQVAARVLRGSGEGSVPSFPVMWGLAAVALLAIFVCQESFEGALSSGHPEGLAAVTAHGGVVAAPLAVVLGALVALGLRGASLVVATAARRRRATPARAPAHRRRLRLEPARPSAGVLALNLAGRAPPFGPLTG